MRAFMSTIWGIIMQIVSMLPQEVQDLFGKIALPY